MTSAPCAWRARKKTDNHEYRNRNGFRIFVVDHPITAISESGRDQQTIPLLPVPILQKIAPDLLFSIRVPRLGDTMAWTAPIFVVSGAVDAAVRLADGMRVRRSELTVGAVRSRILREIGSF